MGNRGFQTSIRSKLLSRAPQRSEHPTELRGVSPALFRSCAMLFEIAKVAIDAVILRAEVMPMQDSSNTKGHQVGLSRLRAGAVL